jgi:hypothetical protein
MAKTTKKSTGGGGEGDAPTVTKKTAAKKTAAKKPSAKNATTRKTPVKKSAAGKTSQKKAVAKKAAPKKAASGAGAAARKAVRHIGAADRRQMIAEAAYLRGESQGFLSDERDDWLQAEAEVDALLAKAKIEVRD